MQDYSDETSRGTQGETLGATTMGGESMSGSAQDVVEQTKSTASNMADKARDQVKTRVASQKDRAVDTLGTVTQTLHDTGRELQDKGQPTIGNLMDEAATQIDNLSDYLRGRNVEELFSDIEEMARRKPSVFIGGAFVVGLALARFMKSSRPSSSMDWSRQERSSWAHSGPSSADYSASTGTAGTADYRASLGTTGMAGASGMEGLGGTAGAMGATGAADTSGAYGTPGAMDTSGAFETSGSYGASETYGASSAETTWTSEMDRTNVTDADLEAEDEDLTTSNRSEVI